MQLKKHDSMKTSSWKTAAKAHLFQNIKLNDQANHLKSRTGRKYNHYLEIIA